LRAQLTTSSFYCCELSDIITVGKRIKAMIEAGLFLSGAVLMAFELTASRILSPYLGSSIFVWTAIIGVIMTALSLGYYFGGKLADRKLNVRVLSRVVFLAGVSVFLCFLSYRFVLGEIARIFYDTRISATLASIVLFSLPSFLFGVVTPYATRLKIDKLSGSASVIGRLYAISTLGSIFGTFLTGYFLLGYLGTGKILVVLSSTMIVVSLLLDFRHFFKVWKILAVFFLFLVGVVINGKRPPNIVLEKDSSYQKIFVYDSFERGTKRPIRLLRTSILAQSGRYLDGDDLLFDYIKQLSLISYFLPNARKALFIGGGGYSLPSYMVEKNPQLEADVVEIDPEVSKIASEFFGADNPRLHTFNTDGRSFINRMTGKSYDIIVLDAYKDELVMPFELITREAVQKYYELLNENGVLAINLISAFTGEKSMILETQYNTLKIFFPQVLVFKPTNVSEYVFQNAVIFAFKTNVDIDNPSNPSPNDLLSKVWEFSPGNKDFIFTDDFAPVERLVLSGF
jgi:spermidine synthase